MSLLLVMDFKFRGLRAYKNHKMIQSRCHMKKNIVNKILDSMHDTKLTIIKTSKHSEPRILASRGHKQTPGFRRPESP